MKKKRTRFEDAMTQLNNAFEKAQKAENKESNETVVEPILLKENTKFDKHFIAQELPNRSQKKENIAQELDQAVEKLQLRKKKKYPDAIEHDNNNLKEEFLGAIPNKVDKKIQNLLEKLVQNTVDKRIFSLLEQKLAENNHFSKDDILDQQEIQCLTSTKNIKKNRDRLEQKILQYSKVKLLFFVNLGQSKVKFKDLFTLKEGDIFSLDTSPKNTLSFFINQKSVGSGKVVNSKENRGFQIDSFYQNL